MDKKTKIENLFTLYDVNNSNKIEKNEFMKMLFNFPKNEIDYLINELSKG